MINLHEEDGREPETDSKEGGACGGRTILLYTRRHITKHAFEGMHCLSVT